MRTALLLSRSPSWYLSPGAQSGGGHYDGVGEWGERSGVRVNGFRVDVSQLCSLFSFVRVRWRPGFSPEELRHKIWAVDLAHVINKVPLVFELER